MELTLCTLNVWGLKFGISPDRRTRMAAIGDSLRGSACDVVNLQELFVEADYELLQTALADRFPYQRRFRHGVLGSGLATFSRLPLQWCSLHAYTVSGPFRQWLQGDWLAGKGFSVCEVATGSESGQSVVILNTHMLANYHQPRGRDPYRVHRLAQAHQLSTFLARHVGAARQAVVVTGDFNYDSGHEAFQLLLASLHHVPAGPTFNLPHTRYHSKGRPAEAIDHVLYRSVQPLAVTVDFYNVSDHAGIIARFSLPVEGVVDAASEKQSHLDTAMLVEEELTRLGSEESTLVRVAVTLLAAAVALLWVPRMRGRTVAICAVSALLVYAFALLAIFVPMEQAAMQAFLDDLQ